MAKKAEYVCSECGRKVVGWTGRCPACGAWGTMQEQAAPLSRSGRRTSPSSPRNQAQSLPSVPLSSSERFSTGMEELNRVLGGGLVRDSVTMLTARPGAGKSTLLLQMAGEVARAGRRCLYVSGEESTGQIKARAERVLANLPEEVYLLSTNSMDDAVQEAQRLHPAVLVVDSVQTMRLEEFLQREGSPTQTVQVTTSLVELCKDPQQPMAAFLVGHMTKADEMAGLRTLEHLVDTVLYLDSGNDESLRVLRATKNRFGTTGEIGLFSMEAEGLREITDPYGTFLTRRKAPVAGAAITLQREGTRLIPLEIEALVSANYGPYPTRIGDSLRRDTLNTLISVLEERAGFRLSEKNVVLKATGGLSVSEKAADLTICIAIASAARNFPVPKDTVFFGEVGLTGELKPVRELDRRLREVERLGFTCAYVPETGTIHEKKRLQIRRCANLQEVIRQVFR
uniref:DNA repair protein RadA n=1 Tax=Ndongobacter massiliensis TaxID=1871025 RepID=UPI0009313099|nr:DNA repair protein RadA [Ndongobacter massiliensis]